MSIRTLTAVTALAAVASALALGEARAHPHVWVTVETEVVYDKGAITGLRQIWTFDEYYSAMAVEGLDANGDGAYDERELADLAKANIEGLTEYKYFTAASLAGKPLEFGPPADYRLTRQKLSAAVAGNAAGSPARQLTSQPADTLAPTPPAASPTEAPAEPGHALTLTFTLPLAQPVLADAEDFSFSTADETFYIWFELKDETAVRLTGDVPKSCHVAFRGGEGGEQLLSQLNQAFSEQLGTQPATNTTARSAVVTCKA